MSVAVKSKEFVEDILGVQDRSRAVVVAAPADAPPLLRMQGAAYATAVAEYFRDQGKHRVAADGLAPPVTPWRSVRLRWPLVNLRRPKGYPPSCFAKLHTGGAQLATASMAWAPSRPSTPCFQRVMTSRSDCRCCTGDFGWSHCAFACLGRNRTLSRHRHRAVRFTCDAQRGHA